MKIRVPKLLREISIRELHNDLLSKTSSGLKEVYDENDKVIISDTALRSLIPPNIKRCQTNTKKCVAVRFV